MTETKDVWDMEVSFDNEVKHSFSGSKTRTITEVLVGVKQWMETKKKELWTQTTVRGKTVQ